jgi:hypothetical protein
MIIHGSMRIFGNMKRTDKNFTVMNNAVAVIEAGLACPE